MSEFKDLITNDKDFWEGETIALLTLSLMKGIGYWILKNIASSDIGFKHLLKCNTKDLAEHLKNAGCKSANQLAENWVISQTDLWKQSVKFYREELQSQNINVIHFKQNIFPQSLREIPDPPRWLFVQGDLSVLHKPSIAIVGTRNPSEDGKFLAHYVGKSLFQFNDIVTVSGLANGIDQIIHRQSIRFNVPTVAFIGTGILLNYPNGSEELRQEIIANGGAIISEYLPNQSYSAENFVRRNRLQSGLANVLIPVEWTIKGGTAHTVRFAHEAQKSIICLRLPDWGDSHAELDLAQNWGAKIFTIPSDESKFIESVKKSFASQEYRSELKSVAIKSSFHQLSILE